MSKGPGKIERAILATFAAEPHAAFSVDDLCARVYQVPVEKKHRVAVVRAAKVIARRGGIIRATKSGHRGRKLYFYAGNDFESAIRAVFGRSWQGAAMGEETFQWRRHDAFNHFWSARFINRIEGFVAEPGAKLIPRYRLPGPLRDPRSPQPRRRR